MEFGRKIAIIGRSLENTVEIASNLGYLDIPDEMLIPTEDVDKARADRLTIITTGYSGRANVSSDSHGNGYPQKGRHSSGDTIIISASPIPGNEKDIGRTINHLFRQGADVIYDSSLVCMLQDMQVKKSLSS